MTDLQLLFLVCRRFLQYSSLLV